jgi:hypothetical protein
MVRTRSMRSSDRVATASRTSGQNGATAAVRAYTGQEEKPDFHRPTAWSDATRPCPPAPATSYRTTRPANAARASSIRSTRPEGRTAVNVSPAPVWAKASTPSGSYVVRPDERGGTAGATTRRVIGLSPSRASPSAHASIALLGFDARSRQTRRRKYFYGGERDRRWSRRKSAQSDGVRGTSVHVALVTFRLTERSHVFLCPLGAHVALLSNDRVQRAIYVQCHPARVAAHIEVRPAFQPLP